MAFEFRLPDVGEGVVEGEIVQWFIEVGDRVQEDQPIVEVMTDKATVEISSPVSGKVVETRGEEGERVDVGEILVVIERDGDEQGVETPEPASEQVQESAPSKQELDEKAREEEPTGDVLATPAVRKKARDSGVDLSQVKGTGPGGRITAEDLERYSEEKPEKPARSVSSEEPERIPYRGLRRKIGTRLSNSVRTAVHYSYVEEVDVTDLVALRRQAAKQVETDHLTYLPFIFKAVASGLKKHPFLNATLDEENSQILLKKQYNIGIATATAEGLIVPVIRDVDQKRILDLAEEISGVVERARKGEARLDELQGGTFTVTSLGPLGGIAATPIINYPEVAILGVHKIVRRPVVKGEGIVVREMMNLSISLDHRVIDGMIAAQFIHHVKAILEAPGLLLFE